jgi:sulfite exporter TauE/SafE
MSVFIAAFLLGLTSNIHCIGMCGPIALALPLNKNSNLSILSGLIQYTLGRIFTYSMLGFIIGIIGLTVNTLGILQWVSILTGFVLIFYAVGKWIGIRIPLLGNSGFNLPFISKGFGTLVHAKYPFKLFFFGLLNGLLPCGMVYFALLNALIAGDMLHGAFAMVVFGLGTGPGLIIIAFAANKLPNQFRLKFSKYASALLFSVGFLIVLRGMNLNIPMVSPKVEYKVNTNENTENTKAISTEETVEMSCCHNKAKCQEKIE